MKIPLTLILASIVSLPAVGAVIPEPMTQERYEATTQKSPFALATKQADPEKPPEPTVSFAKDMFVTGISYVSDNVPFVSIQRMGGESFRLTGNETGPDGIRLVSVDLQEGRKSTVKLKKGNETAVVKMDESKDAAASNPAPAPGAAHANRGVVVPGNAGRPAGIPPVPGQVTAVKNPAGAGIPQPGFPQNQQNNGRGGGRPGTQVNAAGNPTDNPPVGAPGTERRRRIRQINN